ncbi:MAG: hypothetical protein F6J96_18520 [Symploca sp. SIO1C2]|nr:hypothetical protein [Symploca sp. SIO1C2]
MRRFATHFKALLFVCFFVLIGIVCSPAVAQADPCGEEAILLTEALTTNVNTNLTPNSNAVATPSGQTNDLTSIQILAGTTAPLWNTSVSTNAITATLTNTVQTGLVKLEKGSTVTYFPLVGSMYTVNFNGTIVDNGTKYKLQNVSLGNFPSNS